MLALSAITRTVASRAPQSPSSFLPDPAATRPISTSGTPADSNPTVALPAAALPLAAVFAPWYGYDAAGECRGDLGSYYWNNDRNMTGVVDQPAPGYYCSANPAIIRWQLDLLADAGVQALFVSWWDGG